MSQFVYSLNVSIIAPLLNEIGSSLPVSDKNLINGSVVFSKKNVSNQNFLYQGADYAYMVGSYMKNGKTGESVIKDLLDNFNVENIAQYKKDIKGMWSALIFKDGHTYIFNDYYSLYDIYYNEFCVSNSLKYNLLMCSYGGREEELEEFPFIMETFQSGAFPGKTQFKKIKKLQQDEYLECTDCVSMKKIPGDLAYDIHYTSEECSIEELTALLRKYAREMNEAFGKPSVFMTGGLDSRLNFASFKAAGVDFTCRYGVGKNTQEADKLLSDEIARAYNKEFRLMDWNVGEVDIASDQKVLFDSIGFYNFIDSSSLLRHQSFADCSRETPFYAFGYFCEAIRLREWAELKGAFFSLYDYIDNYYIDKHLIPCYKNYNKYRDYLIENYKNQLKKLGVEENYDKIPIDIFERFRWMMAKFSDSRFEVVLNNYGYAFSLLSIPEIHERILALPANVIKDGKFQIKLIYHMDAKLITDFDVFSHLRWYKIDCNFKKIKKITIKNIGDVILRALPFIKPVVLKIYRKRRYDFSQSFSQIIKYCIAHKTLGLGSIDIENYKGSLNRLSAFYVGMNELKNRYYPYRKIE